MGGEACGNFGSLSRLGDVGGTFSHSMSTRRLWEGRVTCTAARSTSNWRSNVELRIADESRAHEAHEQLRRPASRVNWRQRTLLKSSDVNWSL